jgi:hypothetical protein
VAVIEEVREARPFADAEASVSGDISLLAAIISLREKLGMLRIHSRIYLISISSSR